MPPKVDGEGADNNSNDGAGLHLYVAATRGSGRGVKQACFFWAC